MERFEGARTPFEAYCYHCRVTFPAGARRCLHCGGRLSAFGEAASPAGASAAPGGDALLPVPASEEESAALTIRRFGGLAVWALVALSAVLSNLCRG